MGIEGSFGRGFSVHNCTNLSNPRDFPCVFRQQHCAFMQGTSVQEMLDLKVMDLGVGQTRGRPVVFNLYCHFKWILSLRVDTLQDMSERVFTLRCEDRR